MKTIKVSRIRRLGHLYRHADAFSTEKVTLSQIEGTRRRGRPPTRWLEDVEKDRKWESSDGRLFEHAFAASKTTDHDVVGKETENISANPQSVERERFGSFFKNYSIKKRERCKRGICVTMDLFDHPRVLSLRQMAMTKLAITVCHDPEILNFMKTNGCASFVFPSKEAHLYLEVESPNEETWISGDCLTRNVSNPYIPGGQGYVAAKHVECIKRSNILPFARWEELVEKKISSLPKDLQYELLDVVRSCCIEIDKWIRCLTQYWKKPSEVARSFQYDFQWNSLGKIDGGRTAEKLITNERLDITARYILASLYDLRDKMPIGEKVPDETVQRYSGLSDECTIKKPEWIPHFGIKNNDAVQKDIYFTASNFEKWLFLKTSLWVECLQYEYFLFFVSHMSENGRKSLLKKRAFKILRMYFLDWPLQCKFLNAAEKLLPYFTESNFHDMLRSIIYERIMLGRQDFNYIDLLKEFWSLSPSNLKESIRNNPIYESLMLIINFPVGKIFPREKLLESYDGVGLTFTYAGIKYRLIRNEIKRCDLKSTRLYDTPYSFFNLISFKKALKRKHDLIACSGDSK
ncbi:uncharacterized protein TNCV_236541 [Trichonephila clavipes]|nr:uncharacterized protein TNCV_236541 [Trichonephila clavipes]